MKKNNDWKDRLNVVYSTNPDFKFDNGEEDEPETLEPGKQQLRISSQKSAWLCAACNSEGIFLMLA